MPPELDINNAKDFGFRKNVHFSSLIRFNQYFPSVVEK